MNKEIILYNARLVLPDSLVTGTIVLNNGLIKSAVAEKKMYSRGIDCEGDFILPGLIELHTDNLEKYVVPRPGIFWPSMAASIIAHDTQVLGAGITTVLDAVALGFDDSAEARSNILDKSVEAVKYSQEKGLLRADHFLHLRCELPSKTVFDSFNSYVRNKQVKLISVMDHTPGQRQWRDLGKWRTFHSNKKWSDEDALAVIERRKNLRKKFGTENRRKIMKEALDLKLPVASHDDTTEEQCIDAVNSGISISEFPTTLEASKKAGELGMYTVMGAPNIVRGESHSGNVSARILAENGLLDGLSSDYMPISLLHAAFEMSRQIEIPLYEAVRKVTMNIAEMVRLSDRGVIEKNKKADIIKVKLVDNFPLVRSVYKKGKLVYNL